MSHPSLESSRGCGWYTAATMLVALGSNKLSVKRLARSTASSREAPPPLAHESLPTTTCTRHSLPYERPGNRVAEGWSSTRNLASPSLKFPTYCCKALRCVKGAAFSGRSCLSWCLSFGFLGVHSDSSSSLSSPGANPAFLFFLPPPIPRFFFLASRISSSWTRSFSTCPVAFHNSRAALPFSKGSPSSVPAVRRSRSARIVGSSLPISSKANPSWSFSSSSLSLPTDEFFFTFSGVSIPPEMSALYSR
mmetsp:Transcript_8228/g.15773  ORF Transcript_8228/g.15773 Transcript_8228/m.15773 type:complete len:249 (+) Transcript_8228:233-979(+)